VGRSRAEHERLSATLSLTTKRKSARDRVIGHRRIGRVKYEMGGIGGEKEGDKGASTGVLVEGARGRTAPRHARRDDQRERGPGWEPVGCPLLYCWGQSSQSSRARVEGNERMEIRACARRPVLSEDVGGDGARVPS
jgi:hypothetical protein